MTAHRPIGEASGERTFDQPSDQRLRVVILFGGQSAEHDVSRISARHVLGAADGARYDLQPVGITKSGQWVLAHGAAEAMIGGASDQLPTSLEITGTQLDPMKIVTPQLAGQDVVVFPLLHGPMGEDGTVQGMLELANVAYVGCGVLSSALAMDKAKAKEVFAYNGIPQVRHVSFHESETSEIGIQSFARRVSAELGFPIFVKPANMGSSIGVSKVDNVDDLGVAIELALSYDEWIVCEEGVRGREIECAVIGNLEPRSSVPGEVKPGAEFYDYEDKYFDGNAQIEIPADLSPERTSELQRMAIKAYSALRCEGMARVDFFLEEPGRGLLVNEINTIPGFTPISMYPRMWEASGLAYSDLIDELIALALERRHRRGMKRRVD